MFNWLQAIVPGARCLDLFAGTGALGLEALSRGAAAAVFVERDRRLAEALREVAASWPGGDRMEVVQADALRWLAEADRQYDLVFIDPPFTDALQKQVLQMLERYSRARCWLPTHASTSSRLPVRRRLIPVASAKDSICCASKPWAMFA